jgi:hypothetical protein
MHVAYHWHTTISLRTVLRMKTGNPERYADQARRSGTSQAVLEPAMGSPEVNGNMFCFQKSVQALGAKLPPPATLL